MKRRINIKKKISRGGSLEQDNRIEDARPVAAGIYRKTFVSQLPLYASAISRGFIAHSDTLLSSIRRMANRNGQENGRRNKRRKEKRETEEGRKGMKVHYCS